MKKNILITGTSRGIGKALALKFLSQSATVIGSGRNIVPILANYPNFFYIKLDLTDSESIINAVQQVKDNFNELDILINNSGIGPDLEQATTTQSNLEETLRVNLTGTILFTESLVKELKVNEKIINISSKMGSIETCKNSDSIAYRISKTALNMYTQILTNRVKHNLKIAAVHPGWVKTTIAPSNINGRLTPDEAAQKIYDFIVSPFSSGVFWDIETNQEIPW